MKSMVAFIAGLIFAVGLALSGMTQPQKVLGFLDFRNWDPTLLFVMAGAVGFHGLAYALLRKRPSPLLDTEWHIPKRRDIDARLLMGAAIFGIGWGLGGYCPGPALTSLLSGDLRPVVFSLAMIGGMIVYLSAQKRAR